MIEKRIKLTLYIILGPNSIFEQVKLNLTTMMLCLLTNHGRNYFLHMKQQCILAAI